MKNYDNFFLGVTNLDEAKKYYQNVLGLETKFDFSKKGMIAFKVGDEEPAIILKDKNVFPNIKPKFGLKLMMLKKNIKDCQVMGFNFYQNHLK